VRLMTAARLRGLMNEREAREKERISRKMKGTAVVSSSSADKGSGVLFVRE